MNKKFVNIFAIVILILFAGTIFNLFYTLSKESKSNAENSQQLFNKIEQTVEQNLSNLCSLDFYKKTDEIQSFQVKLNNKDIIAYPSKEICGKVKSTRFVRVYTKSIENNEDIYEIKASVYLLKPVSIYDISKKSFFIILCLTIITTLLLIYISISENKKDESEKDFENDEKFEDTAEEEQDFSSEEEPVSEPETAPEVHNEENDFQENTEPAAESEAAEESEPAAEENPYYTEPVAEQETCTPPIDYEQFIFTVNTALSKAASNEADVSLFLIGVNHDSKEASIIKELNDNFGDENVFKYKTNIFAVIKEETTIDEAEEMATYIQHGLSKYSNDNSCYIGISSRSIRMLGADRLIMEAEEALNHAYEDPESPIIGFHVDIEKYREFLKNN